MSEESGPTDSLPITTTQLRVIYVAGIALNAVALVLAASRGQQIGALTLGLIIVYLSARLWLLGK